MTASPSPEVCLHALQHLVHLDQHREPAASTAPAMMEGLTEDEADALPEAFKMGIKMLSGDSIRVCAAAELAVAVDLFEVAGEIVQIAKESGDDRIALAAAALCGNPAADQMARDSLHQSYGDNPWFRVRYDPTCPVESTEQEHLKRQLWPGGTYTDDAPSPSVTVPLVVVDGSLPSSLELGLAARLASAGASVRRLGADPSDHLWFGKMTTVVGTEPMLDELRTLYPDWARDGMSVVVRDGVPVNALLVDVYGKLPNRLKPYLRLEAIDMSSDASWIPDAWRVSRDDLLCWRDAERELPRLVRRLIEETVPSVEKIRMPAGTGVAQPGWDGIVECAEGNRFVPSGSSRWELSAQKTDPDRKARSDYTKRVKSTPPSERSASAYVAAICAKWPKAETFENEMSHLNDFRTVRALTVDDLENWLEHAPETTLWMHEQLNRPITGIQPLSRWWKNWLDSTTVPLNAQLVLAGRDQQAEFLRDWRGGSVVTIGGDYHRDEILAFVAAALEPTDAGWSDVMYVDDRTTAQRLLGGLSPSSESRKPTASPVTVVAPSQDFADCLPSGSQHRLIVPVPGERRADIVLEPVDSKQVSSLLQNAGMNQHEASDLGGLARMSLLTLRRRLAKNPELHRPRWASGRVSSTVRRCVLLNSWSAACKGDREAVERFVNRPYADSAEELMNFGPSDAPMTLTDGQWHVVSPEDAWDLVSAHLSNDDINEFAEIAHEVLTESDPFFGMSANESPLAQYEGSEVAYSRQFRRGVATTLALLSIYPPQIQGSPVVDRAGGIVRRVLTTANADMGGEVWAQVAHVLPLLAEAAPMVVLAELRSCLDVPNDFASTMFGSSADNDFFFDPPPPHVHVLRALEVLAWSPDHINAAASVLARLADDDPGGRLSNRPINSLKSILCPWMPYTSADTDARMRVLGTLREHYSRVAWDLMISMLPTGHDVQGPESRGPRYRRWKRPQHVTHKERRAVVNDVGLALVQDAGQDPERCAELVSCLGNLTPPARSNLAECLSEIAESDPSENLRSVVWPQLRHTLARHREFADTNWALTEDALAPFDPLLRGLCPEDTLNEVGWLFSDIIHETVDGIRWADDREGHESALAARRIKAVGRVLDSGGLDAVMTLASKVMQPFMVGVALAGRADASDTDEDACRVLDRAEGPVLTAILAYFDRRFKGDWPRLMRQLTTACDPPPRVIADLLRVAPADTAPWNKLDGFGQQVASEYWQRVHPREFRNAETDEMCEAVKRFRNAHRAADTIELLFWWLYCRQDKPITQPVVEAIADCLDDWLQQGKDEGLTASYELPKLLEVADQHSEHLDPHRLAQLKWSYRLVLEQSGSALAEDPHRMIAQNPDIFVSLVDAAYKPASADRNYWEDTSETERQAASNAYVMLDSWPAGTFNPGADSDSEEGVNGDTLNAWVREARRRFKNSDRSAVGDMCIGKALASSPADMDTTWPALSVRKLIEETKSDDLGDGLYIAIFNQRGVTSRAPTDGGDQERYLVDDYTKRARLFDQEGWHRTAAIFDRLAQSYEHEAAWADQRAESVRRGLWD